MFRENKSHLQGNLFSTVDELPDGARKVLEKSWAGTFYEEVFCRIDEKAFAVLYSEIGSRPNVPVNVLVSLEILKHGNGWTDEETYANYLLDLVVRVAVGYTNLQDGYFGIRTIYNFRDALSEHMEKTGENLLDKAFEQITDEQLKAYGLKSDNQRMDSTQIMSNIRQYSRLSLLVEVLRRVHRMLSKEDQLRYGALLAPYLKETSEHYVYRLKKNEYPSRLEGIGQVMHQLVSELAAKYSAEETYATLIRAFGDHFKIEEDEPKPEPELIPGSEVKADSLQSPDDPEATYRNKRGESYRGYVANAAETCNPENDFQLITKTQVESNTTDDAQMLIDAIPNLAQRTEIDTCHTDGGYNSPDLEPLLEEHDINHIQSAIRGGKSDPNKVTHDDFLFEFNQEGLPIQATCPKGQIITLELGRTKDRFIGRPDYDACQACSHYDVCTVRPPGKQQSPALYLNKRQIQIATKRQATHNLSQEERNLRPPVESAMRSLKHPFRHGKVPLRGKFRITCAIISTAFMTNCRRIHRHQQVPATEPLPAAPAPFAELAGTALDPNPNSMNCFSCFHSGWQPFDRLRLFLRRISTLGPHLRSHELNTNHFPNYAVSTR